MSRTTRAPRPCAGSQHRRLRGLPRPCAEAGGPHPARHPVPWTGANQRVDTRAATIRAEWWKGPYRAPGPQLQLPRLRPAWLHRRSHSAGLCMMAAQGSTLPPLLAQCDPALPPETGCGKSYTSNTGRWYFFPGFFAGGSLLVDCRWHFAVELRGHGTSRWRRCHPAWLRPDCTVGALGPQFAMHLGRAVGALGPQFAMHLGRAVGALGPQFAMHLRLAAGALGP